MMTIHSGWRRLGGNGLKLLLFASLSVLLVSCETVSYYSQAARGQLAILWGRERIEALLARADLDPDLREKFTSVLAIREYAEQELALPVEENYLTYVDLGREHVVWNVFAAPEFSVDPVNWCYPIAGCVSYRGYFSEAASERFASQLAEKGYDVYTGGVDAYSTLGWFDDSLLSSVARRADYQLAALIFHELAHQVVYIPGDTTFNESFATTVEREGIRRWLGAGNHEDTLARAETDVERQQQFVALVLRYRDRFADLYDSELLAEPKRAQKLQIQNELRADYAALKQTWGGYGGYDSWFANSLNNAQLSTVSSYNDLVPFFQQLLRDTGGNMQAFYGQVEKFAQLDATERASRVDALAALGLR
jgi:predicted aminopeptidase